MTSSDLRKRESLRTYLLGYSILLAAHVAAAGLLYLPMLPFGISLGIGLWICLLLLGLAHGIGCAYLLSRPLLTRRKLEEWRRHDTESLAKVDLATSPPIQLILMSMGFSVLATSVVVARFLGLPHAVGAALILASTALTPAALLRRVRRREAAERIVRDRRLVRENLEHEWWQYERDMRDYPSELAKYEAALVSRDRMSACARSADGHDWSDFVSTNLEFPEGGTTYSYGTTSCSCSRCGFRWYSSTDDSRKLDAREIPPEPARPKEPRPPAHARPPSGAHPPSTRDHSP